MDAHYHLQSFVTPTAFTELNLYLRERIETGKTSTLTSVFDNLKVETFFVTLKAHCNFRRSLPRESFARESFARESLSGIVRS